MVTDPAIDILPWQLKGFVEARELLRQLDRSSLLLAGPEGVGRRQLARWYAAYLNCVHLGAEPCGSCPSCLLWRGGHPDYREVAPAALTTSGRLNRNQEIRIGQLVPREGQAEESLSEWLLKRPLHRFRVGVIDSADKLTPAAANSFLKMLEEPPSWCRIVLVAPDPRSLLPTISSRVTVLRLRTASTDGLEPLSHPAHLLGTPGPLARARAEHAAWEEASGSVAAYVNALQGSLTGAFEAAVELERSWLAGRFDVPQLLRASFRRLLAPAAYAAADDALANCEAQLAGYVNSGIALQLLTLELRRLLSS